MLINYFLLIVGLISFIRAESNQTDPEATSTISISIRYSESTTTNGSILAILENSTVTSTALNNARAINLSTTNSLKKLSKSHLLIFIICFFTCCLFIFLSTSWLLFTQNGKVFKKKTIDYFSLKYSSVIGKAGGRADQSDFENVQNNKEIELLKIDEIKNDSNETK